MDFVSGIVGAGVGFAANYVLERIKRRHAMSDARRKAYAAWFTNEELLRQRIRRVCEKLVGFPKDESRHAAVTLEVASLANEAKTLAAAMNEAFLAENSRHVRKQLSVLTELLVGIADTLDFAARHYGENLEFHKQFAEMDEGTLSKLPAEKRTEWERLKADFAQHDATCPFKSPTFRSDLETTLATFHKNATELRNALAGRLSY